MQDQYVTFSGAWFTLSLINAGLAQSKQRSGLNWWFISLLFGPLATLVIVASPPGTGEGAVSSGTMTTNQAVIIGAGVLVIIAAFAIITALLNAGA